MPDTKIPSQWTAEEIDADTVVMRRVKPISEEWKKVYISHRSEPVVSYPSPQPAPKPRRWLVEFEHPYNPLNTKVLSDGPLGNHYAHAVAAVREVKPFTRDTVAATASAWNMPASAILGMLKHLGIDVED